MSTRSSPTAVLRQRQGDYGTLTRTAAAFSLREKDGSIEAFRPDGSLDYVQDGDGNRITAGYTGSLMTSLTSSDGRSLTLSYNAQGHLTEMTDPGGKRRGVHL